MKIYHELTAQSQKLKNMKPKDVRTESNVAVDNTAVKKEKILKK